VSMSSHCTVGWGAIVAISIHFEIILIKSTFSEEKVILPNGQTMSHCAKEKCGGAVRQKNTIKKQNYFSSGHVI
jgi:hypothetical protein